MWARTEAGVERVGVATTVAESHDALRALRVPALAVDGVLVVGASGSTSSRDVAAIVSAVVRHDDNPEALSCAWPGCCEPTARVHENTAEGLVDLCRGHRRLASEQAKRVDIDSPRAVLALIRAVGPMHCADRFCAPCRKSVLAAAKRLAGEAAS